jgi:hypothetical protein
MISNIPLNTYPSLSTVQKLHPKLITIYELLMEFHPCFGDLLQLCYTTFSLFSWPSHCSYTAVEFIVI